MTRLSLVMPLMTPTAPPKYASLLRARQPALVALALTAAAILAILAVGSAREVSASYSKFTAWQAEHWAYITTDEAKMAQDAVTWRPPKRDESNERCSWVIDTVTARDVARPHELKRKKYLLLAESANAFYRATAGIFWQDFVQGGWGQFDLLQLGGTKDALEDGSPLEKRSTWTWVTGDQHLSNFGAWRNRHGDVVYSINDFDEAAVYDFQIDVWRLAVSIHNHAITNGLGEDRAAEIVMFFCDEYVRRLQEYVGNENALTFEVTPDVATGKLQQFLQRVEQAQSQHKQMSKFTYKDERSSERRLVKSEDTALEAVSADVEEDLRRAFGKLRYGATMSKIGWRAKAWKDDYFRVLDVAARVGSGVGSYGVSRYYVLLAGRDDVGPGEVVDGQGGVILDVKYEPARSAVAAVLNDEDAAWYRNLFTNEAMRAVEAQRRLTSYTDPFTGWALINGKPYVVRQRSPWKSSFSIGDLETFDDLAEYVAQIAVITATSHARGTYSASPAQFKEVIAAVLGRYPAHKAWGASVARVAAEYREQVLLDFNCFQQFVARNWTHSESNGKDGKPPTKSKKDERDDDDDR